MITTLEKPLNTYNAKYDVITNIQNLSDLNNKLFCTFTDLEGLDTLIENITSKYDIIYNKLFVLEIVGKDEYVVTYNVDQTLLTTSSKLNVDIVPSVSLSSLILKTLKYSRF